MYFYVFLVPALVILSCYLFQSALNTQGLYNKVMMLNRYADVMQDHCTTVYK